MYGTSSSLKWTEGIIAEVTSPLSYQIKLTDGSLVHPHVDSIKCRETEVITNDQDQDLQNYDFDGPTSGIYFR